MNRQKMMDYANRDKYRKVLENPAGVGVFLDEQEGNKITIYMHVHREVITEITYDDDSKKLCYPAAASAEFACEYLTGKAVMEAALFKTKTISDFFDGLDKGSVHSAIMVEMAMKRAIADYLQRKKLA